MAHRLTTKVLRLCLLAAIGANAAAQGLTLDPTRPPDAVAAVDTPIAGGSGAPVLQSVIVPHSGKAIAIIGGQEVKVGGMVGDSRLVRVNDREAVLEGPLGIVRLPLTPAVEKKNVAQKSVREATQIRGQP